MKKNKRHSYGAVTNLNSSTTTSPFSVGFHDLSVPQNKPSPHSETSTSSHALLISNSKERFMSHNVDHDTKLAKKERDGVGLVGGTILNNKSHSAQCGNRSCVDCGGSLLPTPA